MLQRVPLVSVVVPCWNSAPWLAAAIGSVLRQTLGELEVILVDDGSSDATPRLARELAAADARVRLVLRPDNRGSARTRNEGLALARGPWIAVFDADDRMEPDRLARLVRTAETVGADWLADDQWIEVEGGERARARLLFDEPAGPRPLALADFLDRDPPETIGYGTLKPLVRRAFLERHGIRWRPEAGRSEDFLFAVECMEAGAASWLLPEPLYRYRLRPGSQVTRLDPLATLDHMLHVQALAERALAAHRDLAVAAALARRRARIEAARLYRRTLDAVRRGALVEVGRALRERPRLSGLLARGLAEALARRLRGTDVPTLANRPLFRDLAG
ncbi:MAG: glycosyltransferase family 2 protein [Geminicoccaceae bacterium]|nr:glycosyltransferase family 2 protein [Geminicoccaceae bacterium]